MIVKAVEIRDRGTFIPAIAIRMLAANERQRWLLARCGFRGDGVTLMRIGDQRASADPYKWGEWGGRTMPVAHQWLETNFDDISDGAVIDVEFILGETEACKRSERDA